MSLNDTAMLVASALVRAANEHGVPNSFGPGEIAAYYAGAEVRSVMQIGRAAPLVCAALRERGWEVSYAGRRFSLGRAGAGYEA